MRSSWNLKLDQWIKLFIMFTYRLMQCLNIFRPWEGYEFGSLDKVQILEKEFCSEDWAWPIATVATDLN
jgi:hypothetical protein